MYALSVELLKPYHKPVCFILSSKACADPEGGTGGPEPLENHKNIVFLSNTGPDPLKNHKATKPAFNVGQSSARLRNVI